MNPKADEISRSTATADERRGLSKIAEKPSVEQFIFRGGRNALFKVKNLVLMELARQKKQQTSLVNKVQR